MDTGVVSTKAEAVKLLMEEHIKPNSVDKM